MNRARSSATGLFRANNKGFTLIELLVVVAIIAVLIAMLLPSLNSAREQARKVICGSGLGQVGKAFYAYAQDNADALPNFRNSQNITFSSWGGYVANGGVSDLVKKPIGFSNIGYLPDARYFMCANDNRWAPYRDPADPVGGWAAWDPTAATKQYARMSYWYFYNNRNIPMTGSPTLAIRDRITMDDPSKLCLMFDEGYPHIISPSYPLYHPDGWNVLYLDSHVKFQLLDEIDYKALNTPGAAWNGRVLIQLFDQEG